MGKKYSGVIGFAIRNEESDFDVYDDVIVERPYTGTILDDITRYNTGDTLSGDVTVTNQFSIVGDTFLFKNFSKMRYISWKGDNWIIASRTEKYPRVKITLGGLYNGPTPEIEQSS